MNRLVRAATEVQALLESKGIGFCFIGGFAAQRYAEPRFTRDVGVSVLTGLGNEPPVTDAVLSRFGPRRDDARDFALRARALLLRTGERWHATAGPSRG